MENFEPNKFEKNAHPYTIKRLSPSIGAELLDIDLKKPLSDSLKDEIYQALLVYKVIFFRDQDLTIEEHMDFAKNFGELEIHPFASNDEQYPEVLKITHNEKNKGRENTWHSDVTW
nr:TauD/TfdA family dioxygenase [SAR86 cluster bacterium]